MLSHNLTIKAMIHVSFLLLVILLTSFQGICSENKRILDAVMLTTGKDIRVFEKSLNSALEHLIDVNDFYIITPNAKSLNQTIGSRVGSRVHFIEESIFPWNWVNVTEIMYDAVKQRGNYVLDNRSPFEHTLYSRTGWFLQQILKMYAGKVLGLDDYLLLDSDLIWYRNISFIAAPSTDYPNVRSYYYTTSNQYHPPYFSCLKRVLGFGLPEKVEHRSGITHHMVISRPVMESLMDHVEAIHQIPFWQVLLNQSALELTCRAPGRAICGAGSTLSEYEIYFNYARIKYPQSVVYRPLLWANGPMPGLLFWPTALESDGPKSNWKGYPRHEVDMAFEKQVLADEAQGYDFIGYHGYAKRRYFELVGADRDALCKDAPAVMPNSTCSWNGYEAAGAGLSPQQWFHGCGCYMAMHPSGP